jgi:hypothetical protein
MLITLYQIHIEKDVKIIVGDEAIFLYNGK